jgi:hypothetical protein
VVFRRLRIQIESPDAPEQLAAAVAVHGGQVTFEKCVFVQKDVTADGTAIASVLVAAGDATAGAARPVVAFQDCFFHRKDDELLSPGGGQTAIAVDGPAELRVLDCAFKPHAALVYLRDRCRLAAAGTGTSVVVDHCSAFVVNGPVFKFDEKAAASLKVESSVFGRPEDLPFRPGFEPYLIYQADSSSIRYRGQRNVYQNLSALWVKGAGKSSTFTLDDFQRLKSDGITDVGSEMLARDNGPWNSPQPLHETAPLPQAFQMNFAHRDLGPRRWLAQEMPPPTAPAAPALAVNEKERVLDPDYQGPPSDRIFATLDKGLPYAKPGDTILIRPGKLSPEVEIAPRVLDPGIDLTLKPYPDTQPVLVLGRSVRNDGFFFQLADGRLRLENLHLVLEPKQDGLASQSVVQLGKTGQVTFSRCILTLKGGRRIPLHAVSCMDPKNEMKAETTAPVGGTRVEFVNSFVRGEGDLVHLQAARLLDLRMDNSLVALTGALLSVQGAAEDVPMDRGVRAQLSRVSAFARDAAFALRPAKNGKGLTRTQIVARDCLLVALDPARTMIYLEAAGLPGEDQVNKFLGWKGERNWYANYDKILDQEQPDGAMMMGTMQIEAARWKELAGEPQSRSGRLAFPVQFSDAPLSQAVPEMFRLPDGETLLSDCGADLEPIPSPAAAKKPDGGN